MSLSNDELTKRLLALEAATLKEHRIVVDVRTGVRTHEQVRLALIDNAVEQVKRLEALPPHLHSGSGVCSGIGKAGAVYVLSDEERTKTDLQAVLDRAVNVWREDAHKTGIFLEQYLAGRLLTAVEDCQIHHIRTVADNGDVKFASDDPAALKRLVVYANEVYCTMRAEDKGHWHPFDHVSGLLSQLSNLLAGIRREAESSVKSSNYHGEQYARLCRERDEAVAAKFAAFQALNVLRQDYLNTGRTLGDTERALILAAAALDLAGWKKNQFGGWEPKPGHPSGVRRYKIEHREKDRIGEPIVSEPNDGWRCGFLGKPEHYVWAASPDEAEALGREFFKFRSNAGFDLRVIEVEWQPQPAPKPGPPIPTCCICRQPATWVRRTQVGGEPFHCTEHAKAAPDFGKSNFGETNDDRFFWQRVEDMPS